MCYSSSQNEPYHFLAVCRNLFFKTKSLRCSGASNSMCHFCCKCWTEFVRGLPATLFCICCVQSLSNPRLLSAKTILQHKCSPHLGRSQQSKDVSSFSSSTSSPLDSPENPSQALKPAPTRAHSAPITLPTEAADPIKSPAAVSPPKSVDAFSTVSWSQSQWIAFNDSFAPPRHQSMGPSVKEPQRSFSSSGRSSRFLSDESAEAYGKVAGSRDDCFFSDVFCSITDKAAASTNKIFNGNLTFRG